MLIPEFAPCWIVNQIAPRQLVAVFNVTGDCPQSQRSILVHQILVLVSAHPTTDDYLHGKADLAT
jgi:hypothetical protein